MSATVDPLAEPLLLSNHNNTGSSSIMVDWPKTPVPLFVPQEWQQATVSHATCVYQYENNLLKLVYDCEGSEVIDVLDPEDIIGVKVEVNTHGTLGSPRAAESNGTADPTATLADTQGHAVLTIYAYPRADPKNPPEQGFLNWCGLGKTQGKPNPNYERPQNDDELKQWGHRYAFHRRLAVAPTEDLEALNQLVKAIRQAACLPNEEERGRALVIVNPKSGPKQNAEEHYHNLAQIVFEQANLDHDLLLTNQQHHAMKRMAEPDLLDYTALICMGGDGICHECLQGIRRREDWQQVLQRLTIGFIGAGTSNGMAKSIARTSHEQSSILDASYLIAKGKSNTTDLSEYRTTNNTYWSFLTFSWAWMSSIDIDSEVIRFAGSFRFDVWAVWCLLGSKKYRAKFSYLPVDAKQSDLPQNVTDDLGGNGWVTEEDDFYLFWVSHVPDAAENSYHCPPSRLDDGIFQILLVRAKNASRLTMVKILLGLESGSHCNIPQAEFIKCTAFRLETLTEGINDLDGEVIESGPLQAKVMPAAMKIFCK